MQTILILGAGKSSTVLIHTLLEQAFQEDWTVWVADGNISLADQKIAGHPRGCSFYLDLDQQDTWHPLLNASDLVISMLPPSFHLTVASACLRSGKHFLNASYLSPEMKQLNEAVQERGLVFLCEMGLDPGIDHMSAMEAIDQIHQKGGRIEKFYSHCGGLIAPESDDNPWHYKITWNPRNIVLAGNEGARFLKDGQSVLLPYPELFDPCRTVSIPGAGTYAWYPNRNSMPYINLYGLKDVYDFVRSTLRHPDFCKGWKVLVESGCTDDSELIDSDSTSYHDFFRSKLKNVPHLDVNIEHQLDFLGLFQEKLIQMGRVSSAQILQRQLEEKLSLNPEDHDMILLMHEIGYRLNNVYREVTLSLVVKGEDAVHTAMAKTVGLPLAIAAKLILNGVIMIPGVHIPVHESIYLPVLRELEKKSVRFTVEDGE